MTSDPKKNDSAQSLRARLEDVRGGDKRALDSIVRDYYEQVERAVQRRLQSRFRTEGRWKAGLFSTGDVVHGVFLKVLTHEIKLENPTEGHLVAYLIKAVESQIIDMTRYHQAARRDRRRQQTPTDSAENLAQQSIAAASPWEQAWDKEQRAIYEEALASFPERERSILSLRIEHRRSFAHIADRLGFNTEDAARKAFHTNKARLLVRLERRGLKLPSQDSKGA